MQAGFAAAVPGATMADICRAMNAVLEAEGYGEFCHPPHIRRRGHGLGFGSIGPGDVALDNATVLEPDMLFMIHPNQYLPETGYLLCGEPAVLTPQGAQALTRAARRIGGNRALAGADRRNANHAPDFADRPRRLGSAANSARGI